MENDALGAYLKLFGNIPLPKGKLLWSNNTLTLLPDQFVLPKTTEEPQVAGLVLGRMQKEKFIPSFPLLDHIAKHTEQIITVDEKTAYLFTCGRDIFGNQVEHKPKGDMMIVTNQHKEVMGVARNDKVKGMYKNILDRGIFLRQEMNKKRK